MGVAFPSESVRLNFFQTAYLLLLLLDNCSGFTLLCSVVSHKSGVWWNSKGKKWSVNCLEEETQQVIVKINNYILYSEC